LNIRGKRPFVLKQSQNETNSAGSSAGHSCKSLAGHPPKKFPTLTRTIQRCGFVAVKNTAAANLPSMKHKSGRQLQLTPFFSININHEHWFFTDSVKLTIYTYGIGNYPSNTHRFENTGQFKLKVKALLSDGFEFIRDQS
jgi:hypothetical protein